MSDKVTLPKENLLGFAQGVQGLLKEQSTHRKAAEAIIGQLAGEQVKEAARSTIDELVDEGVLEPMEPEQKQAFVEKMALDSRNILGLSKTIGDRLAEAKVKLATADIGREVDVDAEGETPGQRYNREMAELAADM